MNKSNDKHRSKEFLDTRMIDNILDEFMSLLLDDFHIHFFLFDHAYFDLKVNDL